MSQQKSNQLNDCAHIDQMHAGTHHNKSDLAIFETKKRNKSVTAGSATSVSGTLFVSSGCKTRAFYRGHRFRASETTELAESRRRPRPTGPARRGYPSHNDTGWRIPETLLAIPTGTSDVRLPGKTTSCLARSIIESSCVTPGWLIRRMVPNLC